MKPIELTTETYNVLPAYQRKTEGGRRYAMVNGEWRLVVFVRPVLKPAIAAFFLAMALGCTGRAVQARALPEPATVVIVCPCEAGCPCGCAAGAPCDCGKPPRPFAWLPDEPTCKATWEGIRDRQHTVSAACEYVWTWQQGESLRVAADWLDYLERVWWSAWYICWSTVSERDRDFWSFRLRELVGEEAYFSGRLPQ